MGAGRLDRAIRATCADPDLLAEMDLVIERAGRSEELPYRWDAGGCLILAEAIRRVAGGELFGLFDEVDPDENEIAGEPDLESLNHVVVALPTDDYADAGGVRSLDALFDAAEGFGFTAPLLLPLSGADDPLLAGNGIAYDEALVTRVVARLHAELG